MRRGILIFLILMSLLLSATQPDERLNKLSGREKLEAFVKILAETAETDPGWTVDNFSEALKLAEKIDDINAKTAITKSTADAFYYLNDLKNALKYYLETAEFTRLQHGNNSSEYGRSLGDVAWCYEYLLEFDKAIEIYLIALNIAETLFDWEEIIALSNNIGHCYYKKADYENAMFYYQKTLKAEEEHGQEANLSVIYNSIAMVHEVWNNYERAIDFYNKALAIDRKYNNKDRIAIRLNNLGFLYRGIDQYDKALEHLLEAMDIDQKLGNKNRIAIRANNIASIYIAKKDYPSALKYLKLLEKDSQVNKSPELLASYFENYGHYYSGLHQYSKAIEFQKKNLAITKQFGFDKKRRSAYMDISVIYSESGDYQLAYKYLEKFRQLNDSLFTSEKHRQIRELEVKYETEKKESQITLLQQNAELNKLQIQAEKRIKNLLLIMLVLIIVLVFFILRSYKHKQKVKLVLQAKKAMEQSRLAILGELIAGIVHEINQPMQSISFSLENMQNAISEDFADKDYLIKKTGYMVEDIERMHRIIGHIRTFSHNQADKESGSFNINDSVRNALRMTEERFKKHRIQVELELDPSLPQINGNIYSFEQVVLILLSNANDAVEEKADKSERDFTKKICLRTEKRQKEIVLLVGDNGSGIPEEIIDNVMKPFFTTKETGKGTGLGLSIARGIINEMNGSIEIDTVSSKGTIIKISFDLEVI